MVLGLLGWGGWSIVSWINEVCRIVIIDGVLNVILEIGRILFDVYYYFFWDIVVEIMVVLYVFYFYECDVLVFFLVIYKIW